MRPLISIIIPVYNGEKTVGATIDSVLAQEYENTEIICVNDGSADSTAAVISKIAEKNPRVKLINKQNGGVTLARLEGVKNAKGEYIGFVDSDDIVEAGMYERLYSNAEKYSADISHCGYRLVKSDETVYFYNTGDLIIQNNRQGVSDLIKGERIEPGLGTKLFRRELFQSLTNEKNIMDFTLRNNEDLLMNYILFKGAKKSVFEDFCPYRYIVYENSASKGTVNEHKLLDPVRAARIIYDDCDSSLKSDAADLYVTKLINAATFYGKNAEKIKEFRKSAQNELRNFIGTYLSYSVGAKRKTLAVTAAYMPKLYDTVHKIYLR